MIGYTTIGTNDLKKSVAYYDVIMEMLGAGRFMEDDKFVAWSKSHDSVGFSVTVPFDGEKATIGNGVMIALLGENEKQVKAVYNKAIELGGTDEGAPGPRSDSFYAAYFRDLDGNKLNIFCMTQGK
ncbi:MAG: VOC family protein [Kangiellaceae bacterium]|nr:VOC family protein [Kangiellaceae bacterium]